MSINEFHPTSGRFVKEDGTTVNIADALGGKSMSDKVYDIDNMMPHSGRFIKEDGTCANIADMIANGDIGGGGGSDSGSSDDSAPPIVETYNGQVVQSFISADRPIKGLKLFATTKQKTTTGAQLFDASLIPTTSRGGATLTNNGDGSFTISGEGRLTEIFSIKYNAPKTNMTLKPGAVSISRESIISDCRPYMYFKAQDSNAATVFEISNFGERAATVDITDEMIGRIERYEFGFWSITNEVITPATFFPMVYQDGNGTYEPYTGGIPSPNVDYPQEIQTTSDFTVEVKNSMEGNTTPQTLNITIPEQGFYGIPVSSGGNYTDASGKQWICDEFDFKNKKFIKRVGRVSFDGAEDEQWVMNATTEDKTRFYIVLVNGETESGSKCLCNRLIYRISGKKGSCFTSNSRFYIDVEPSINNVALLRDYLNTHPLDVIYLLETPVEYNLTDAEIEQYKKLRSYYGTTYIDNDAVPACNMTAELVVDTKMYIDSKLSS